MVMGEENVPPRFRKTKTGKWAVMAPVADLEKALAEGGKIEVQKKSGDWSSFTVGSLGSVFDVDGEKMCYGYAPGDEAEGSDGSRQGSEASAGTGRRGSPPPPSAPPEPRFDASMAPQRDPSEPLPEFEGGEEDQWEGF